MSQISAETILQAAASASVAQMSFPLFSSIFSFSMFNFSAKKLVYIFVFLK